MSEPRRPVVLVANRGEIAVRVVEAARRVGASPVVAVSVADTAGEAARRADRTIVIGPAQSARSYLRPEIICQAALQVGADVVHPGYGFLSEQPALAELLDEHGILTDGYEHSGIYLRFNGESHHIDFKKLIGQTVWLYPQNDLFVDLAAARRRDGGDVRYGVSDAEVIDHDTDAPKINFTDADGVAKQIQCEIVIGADGSRSRCRDLIPGRVKHTYRYPFAWFGILVEAPFSSDELIYCHSPKGFVLISQRTPTVQRMYFQCSPEEKVEDWPDERIWEHMDAALEGPDGFKLKRGRIFDKVVLPFRSFVQEPMQDGNLFLAGDAAHTVPPTGAKGLNLAFGDVALLAPALITWAKTGSRAELDTYGERAAKRIWKSQNFSYWMTQMLHTPTEDNPFLIKRQLGELMSVVSSEDYQKYLAECYSGWPYDLPDLMEE